ncbi:MAG TPA: hypothetical protein PLV25_06690, partial [Opitutales bacterium]|nr:hypothetical protein [Opitutales bacterium]
ASSVQGLGNYLNDIIAIRDALKATDPIGLGAARTNLLKGSDNVLVAISETSTKMMRLDLADKADTITYTQSDATITRAVDIDPLEAITHYKELMYAYEAATRAGGSILESASLLDYLHI